MQEQKRLCFDIDSVIAKANSGHYATAEPHLYAIEQVNKAYDAGYYIILHTARYGSRYPGKQWQYGYEETIGWLRKHGVKFHELVMGKIVADLFIDDRACVVNTDDNGEADWINNFWPAVEKLNNRDRYNQRLSK